MLGLQIHAPFHGVIELLSAGFKDINGLGVGATGKITVDDRVQPVDKALLHKAVEEGHFLRRFSQYAANHVLEHVLCQGHIVKQVGKGNFRLHHPKLGGVARGIAFFSAEGGAEGIYVAESHAVGFHV